nr:hypothetical protein BaRGS_017212 [Batillaria attramentaria]
MKTTTKGRKNGIQWTLWTQLDVLDFADDLALLSHSHSQMQDKTTCLEAISRNRASSPEQPEQASGRRHPRCSLSRPVGGGSSDSHTLLETINGGGVHLQGSSDTLDRHAGVQHPNGEMSFSVVKAWHFCR